MYIITFGLSLLFLRLAEKNKYNRVKSLFIILAILLPSILAGVRDYSIGHDVLIYGKSWFERACTYNSYVDYIKKANEYSIGVGYATLNYVVSRFSNSMHMFLFVYQLIQMTILYYAIKPFEKKINIVFAFFIYYFAYYNISLNLLRQIMSMMLVLFSYRYIIGKKPIRFIAVILVAYSMHSAAIIALVLYPVSWAVKNPKLKKIFKVAIVALCAVFAFGYQKIFEIMAFINILSLERYSHYMTDGDVGGRYVRLIYWSILLFIIYWKRKECISEYSDSVTMQMYMIVSGLLTIIMFLGSSWSVRVAYYFDMFQILFLPILVKTLPFKWGNKRNNASYFVLGLFVIIFWVFNFVIRNGAATFPYVFMKG